MPTPTASTRTRHALAIPRPRARGAPIALALLLAAGLVAVPAPLTVAPVRAGAALSLSVSQHASTYDASTNKAKVALTMTVTGATAPWSYQVAVRGTVVATGSTSTSSAMATVTNNCSIAEVAFVVSTTDASGATSSVDGRLSRDLCPPPPDVPHAGDRIMAGPTLTATAFVTWLTSAGSPAAPEGQAIYDVLRAAGVNPAFALGMFNAESAYGTKGYAVTTKNWGNILYYDWETAFGATAYAPGNGYTYAAYTSWTDSVRAYVDLLRRYQRGGYTTVSSASAHWLGTIEGSDRHLRYLTNISKVMAALPTDAIPTMTALTVPATSRAPVTVQWSGRDDRTVTGYQVRSRLGAGPWSAAVTTAATSLALRLGSGAWTIGVRALDGDGNRSAWVTAPVSVDADAPVVTALTPSARVIRTPTGAFTVAGAATDNVGVTRYQWRTRKEPAGTWSTITSTNDPRIQLRLPGGTYTIAMRARDAVGNASAWRATRVVVPADDRSFAFSIGTTRRTGAAYYRATLTTTRRAGARISKSFTGNGVYIVGTAGPAYGRMRVTIDGVAKTVDTGRYAGARATKNHDRALLFSAHLAQGKHTVTITNLATAGRPTIAIDGIALAR